MNLSLRRKPAYVPRTPYVEFDIIGPKGKEPPLSVAGVGGTLTFVQPVEFTDDLTGVNYKSTLTWTLTLKRAGVR